MDLVTDTIRLMFGDCLERMQELPDNSIDAVICDPPYGTTACKWDSIIPLEPMWTQLERVTKFNSAIVLNSSQPFTTTLINSRIERFKYCWIWEKEKGTMPMNAPYQPLKVHEEIVVFSLAASTYSKNGSMKYFPQITKGTPHGITKTSPRKMTFHSQDLTIEHAANLGTRYPRSVQQFQTERNFHPTQKPVALIEYLIRTYTNENKTVLDFTMGSGTTGVACINTNRKFIGIELDPTYYGIAAGRIFGHV